MLQSIRPTTIDTRQLALNENGTVARPVITTYRRVADAIVDCTFSNGETIGCTPNHPFYSTDRQAYIAAADLYFGECILTSGEKEVTFIALKSRYKGESVFNLEVWRTHNYFVSGKGQKDWLLVHNECLPPLKPLLPASVFDNWINGFQPIAKTATTTAYQYQQRVLGTLIERRVTLTPPHNFSKPTLDIDGFDSATGILIEVKHVGNPASSPWLGNSSFEPLTTELMDQLNRYKHVIDDASSPARELRIITNHPDAVTYLENIMNTLDIPGGAILIP